MLGWTQQEIKDAVIRAGYEKEYTRQSVQLRLQEFSKLKKLAISQFESKKPIADIVKENEKYYGLDDTLAWAIVLQGKTDIERFEALGLQPKIYDVWNFAECRTPLAYIKNISNLILRFSASTNTEILILKLSCFFNNSSVLFNFG